MSLCCIDMLDSKEVILRSMGIRLRAFRNDRGYSRKEIAEFLGITERTYASYERGEHDIPMEVMFKLAPFYRTTMTKLIDYKKEAHIL